MPEISIKIVSSYTLGYGAKDQNLRFRLPKEKTPC